ncbi:hypothetical protein C8F04DRAFT_1264306 [Mycena alexandri]|uniref:Ribonuclease H1 N-terminal domain-containing protein n=1 Tax=Mycena alexandri TaxID=1745969 RepID=A0AAD6SML5_9AGAR|nr:hypothetical protein C8F04DRAFT_1264306 [Mycena alexandri]
MTPVPPPSYAARNHAADAADTQSPDNDDDELLQMLQSLNLAQSPSLSPRAHPQYPTTPPRSPSAVYSYRTPVKVATTSSWAEAAAETQGVSGASPRRLESKRKPRRKKGGYAVFCGRAVGAFRHWNEEVVPLVIGVSNSLYQGYPTLAEAQAAFKYAHHHGWTRIIDNNGSLSTTVAPPPSPMNAPEGPNPLHVGSSTSNGLWYVVYAGIAPGVYSSSLECSLNTLGLSASAFESCNSREVAVSLFQAAVAQNHSVPRLKQLPREEQEVFKARARDASARYRATQRQRERSLAATFGDPMYAVPD